MENESQRSAPAESGAVRRLDLCSLAVDAGRLTDPHFSVLLYPG
jgi:hypothetical protein